MKDEDRGFAFAHCTQRTTMALTRTNPCITSVKRLEAGGEVEKSGPGVRPPTPFSFPPLLGLDRIGIIFPFLVLLDSSRLPLYY